ncbi:hexosaminidase D [Myripristis murdjan]|uniref:beta-N-acetylhexosaminidase n=1 Tax=Myripristis murdjan TaxID=586833 RepID=A0A667YIF1_9TELE|nr:hexosaminidase D [Myripristis murdjan]XP_029933416.1 hexosaminidase D [Myripristis murdjan]
MKSSPWPRGRKLVHLDLKGAPPRPEYLHKLIELFSGLGADGLLVEYEDMFPYEGELKVLQATAHPAYSREEVLSIQDVAKSRGLEVIPLVQTFGHMEFVLKHRALWGLREVAHCLGTLNPHKEEGVKLVIEMLRQVVELHPDLHTLHIGADEVYLLGEGEESKLWLASPGRTVEQLFLSHVAKVAKAVKEAWPHLNVIMWDDMLRGMSHDTLKASGLAELVQPMLWDYSPALDVDKTVSLLGKYHRAGLSELWAASSFKGSTCVHSSVTSTHRHVENHLQWLKVAASAPAGVKLQGIALTGWQRYDHLSVLCELMPLAVPSLAACLQTLIQGQFSAEAQSKVMESLGISSVEVEAMERASSGETVFAGRRLAERVVDLTLLLNSEDMRDFENNMFVRGWFTPYHRQRKMVNPLITMQIQSHATTLLAVLQEKEEAVREEMARLYPDATVQEWIEQHVGPVVAPLQRITEDIRACLEEMVPPSDTPSPPRQ